MNPEWFDKNITDAASPKEAADAAAKRIATQKAEGNAYKPQAAAALTKLQNGAEFDDLNPAERKALGSVSPSAIQSSMDGYWGQREVGNQAGKAPATKPAPAAPAPAAPAASPPPKQIAMQEMGPLPAAPALAPPPPAQFAPAPEIAETNIPQTQTVKFADAMPSGQDVSKLDGKKLATVIAALSDALGSGFAGYAGRSSPTMLQKQAEAQMQLQNEIAKARAMGGIQTKTAVDTASGTQPLQLEQMNLQHTNQLNQMTLQAKLQHDNEMAQLDRQEKIAIAQGNRDLANKIAAMKQEAEINHQTFLRELPDKIRLAQETAKINSPLFANPAGAATSVTGG